jgi:hypothetical protein
MALTRRERQQAMAWALKLPGQRGVSVPEAVYDRIYSVGNGITMPLWGRPILPEQIQYLHENGLTEPSQIHQAFNDLPHPHAPNVKVGEYQDYVHAFKAHEDANAK